MKPIHTITKDTLLVGILFGFIVGLIMGLFL